MNDTHWIEFHISTKQTKVVRCYGVNNTIETHMLPEAGLPLISSIIGKRMNIWTHNLCNPDGVSPVSFTGISITPSESYADDFTTDTVSEVLAAFSTPSGSVEVANEYVSRYTGV